LNKINRLTSLMRGIVLGVNTEVLLPHLQDLQGWVPPPRPAPFRNSRTCSLIFKIGLITRYEQSHQFIGEIFFYLLIYLYLFTSCEHSLFSLQWISNTVC